MTRPRSTTAVMTRAEISDLAARAVNATDAEHAMAIGTERCAICGAEPGEQCTYGKLGAPYGASGGPKQFPGRAHTRRVSAYLEKCKPSESK